MTAHKKPALLLVDDDPDVHILVRASFRRLGRANLVIESAADGQAALERIEALGDRLVLILSDVKMPRIDGHSLVRMLRAAGNRTPIVLIGALSSAEHEADEWVEKDGLLERLAEVLDRHIRQKP